VRIRIFFLFLALFLASLHVQAQESDSIDQEIDSSYVNDEDDSDHYYASPDTIQIEKKAFAEDKLRELKNDPSLDYEQLPTVAETLWDRILRWLSQFFNSFFDAAYDTNWGRVLLYAGLVALIIFLVMMLLKVNAFKMFYGRSGASAKFDALEENIHEMDFEKLIQESIDQQNFRKAIRLVFLYSLKLLSDRQLILWELGKTNHDYVGELERTELKKGLNELSFYFDYAWYGNFQVNQETFNKVQLMFQDFKSKL
jgi:hypothetical protein